jgi:hypothetical protein
LYIEMPNPLYDFHCFLLSFVHHCRAGLDNLIYKELCAETPHTLSRFPLFPATARSISIVRRFPYCVQHLPFDPLHSSTVELHFPHISISQALAPEFEVNLLCKRP